MLTLGRALVRLFLARQAARPRFLEYRQGGRTYRLDDRRVSHLGTRFGKVEFARPVGRQVGDRRAVADLLVDRELSLCSGFSLGVVTGVTRLVAQMASGVARETYREIYEWAPSPRAVLRMVDAVGARARGFLEQAAVPADDGALLFMQGDGRGAPMIGQAEHERRRQPHTAPTAGATTRTRRRRRRKERPRVRRTTGKKSKNPRSRSLGVSIRFSQRPRALRARSTRGSTQRSRATWRSSSGCAARQTNAATARSGRSFWAMAASTSGDSSRSTSLRLRRASTGIT